MPDRFDMMSITDRETDCTSYTDQPQSGVNKCTSVQPGLLSVDTEKYLIISNWSRIFVFVGSPRAKPRPQHAPAQKPHPQTIHNFADSAKSQHFLNYKSTTPGTFVLALLFIVPLSPSMLRDPSSLLDL